MRERAVSPVISVILMVAVTVILASVVSVFALDLGAGLSSPGPSANFEFEVLDNGDVQVTHSSGNTLDGDQLRFAGAALEKTSLGDIWSGDVTAGDSATVNVKGGETLRLIWQSPGTDESATLAEYDVPEGVGSSGSVSITNVQSVNDEVTVSVGTLSKVSGEANLVVETSSGTQEEQVSSGDTVEMEFSDITPDETVDATLYESGETGKFASDSSSANTHVSIGSFEANNALVNNNINAKIWLNNIQLNGVPNDYVYVVVKDEPRGGSTSYDRTVDTSPKDLTFDDIETSTVEDWSEIITVKVFKSDQANDDDLLIECEVEVGERNENCATHP